MNIDEYLDSQPKGTLVKLTDERFNGNHPNGIQEGYTSTGIIYSFPFVGSRAIVGGLRTSLVTEIIEDDIKSITFKTLNSTYKLSWT